jgi:glucose/arabinose dehydrogenase
VREGTSRLLTAVTIVLAVVGCATTSSSPRPSPTDSASPTQPSPTQASPRPVAQGGDVALKAVVTDLVAPVGLVVPPGDDDRMFVLEQTGQIHILRDDERDPEPFLDLSDRLVRLDSEYDERGLLGLAFHPDFQSNGRFYVYHSARPPADAPPPADHTNRLSEFRVRTGDPDLADPASERVVLGFEQPQPNHSGGALGFGPDGFLYLGTGDGGGRGDADAGHSEMGNAQDPKKLNGKVLRIDVDADAGAQPEIFADGFRNPWRLSWEPAGERRLLVSDVGYGRYEEIDAVVKGGNYGWRIREGAHCLDIDQPLQEVTDCPTTSADGRPLIDPVVEYTHKDVGIAVVGGYVYRGSAIPALQGRYVFADFSADWTTNTPIARGSLLVADPRPTGAGAWGWERLSVEGNELDGRFVTGMGEGADRELYVMARRSFGPINRTGRVYRIVAPVS